MNREKILDRVKKLLALASNISLNEKEAIVANTEAQKLITRYQIKNAELNSINNKKIEITYSRIDTKNKSDILWKNRLVCYLCEVNNCQFITLKQDEEKLSDVLTKSDKKTYKCTVYTIFGSEENIELIKLLYDLISNQIEYLTKNNFIGKGKSESNSYKLGVITTVGQRLRETKQKIIENFVTEQKSIGNNSNALVYIQKETQEVSRFVNEFFDDLNIGLRKAKERKTNLKREAYNSGLKDGSFVILTNNLMLTE